MKALRTALSALVCLIALSGAAFAQNPGPAPGVYTPPSNGTLPNPITVPINNASQTTTGTFNFTDTTGNGGSKINGGCINGVCPVTAFGAKCDNSTNDATAIQAAFTAAAALCNNASTTATVSFPPANAAGATAICIDNSALTRNACVNVEGNGATLSQTNASSSANLITVTAPTSGKIDSYFRDLHVYGPNGTSVGLLLQTSGGSYEDVDIANVGTGVQVGNNAFLTQFVNFTVSGYNTYGFYCPNSLTNAGENIRWTNGGIYNGNGTGIAINNQNCEFNGDGLSLDFPGDSFIKSATTGPSGPSLGSAATRLLNYHLETSGTIANSDPAIDTGSGSSSTAGCNSYSQVVLRNGIILNDAPGTNSLAIVRDSGVACNAGGAAAWVTIDNSQISGWGNSGTCIASNSQDVGNTCVLGVNATQVKLSNISDGVLAYLSVGPLAVLNGITSTGPTAITGNSGAGGDFIKCVNIAGEVNPCTYAANPRAAAVGSTTALVNASNKNATLGAAFGFINGEGIAIYGAGPNCNINSTDCGSITVTSPTITQTGYIGANSGTVVTYQYQVSACDANWGCTAASTASGSVSGPSVLKHPNTAQGTSGLAGTGGDWNQLTGYGVTAASHYLIWRNKAGGGYLLWAATDFTTFNDWSNTQTMGTNGPYGNTPLAAAQADVLATSIVSGGGTTSVVLNDQPSQAGTLTAWPDATAAFQNAWNSLTNGGRLYVQAGFYHLRSLTPVANTNFDGPAFGVSGSPGAIIQGTPGYDVFSWPSNIGGIGFDNLKISGGRNVWASEVPNVSPIHVNIGGVVTTAMDYSTIYCNKCAMEEWRTTGKENYWSGGWYGYDFEGDGTGTNYIEKSSFDNTTFNGHAVNNVRINNNGFPINTTSFSNDIFQFVGGDCVWLGGNFQGSGVTFNNDEDERCSNDFTSNVTTATCTATSDVVAVTSATGLAVGQNYTVNSCGATGSLPLEGTICNISTLNITLEDPTCTTAHNAGQTQSTAQPATNAPFDDFEINLYAGQGMNGIKIADDDLSAQSTRFRANVRSGGVWWENTAGTVLDFIGAMPAFLPGRLTAALLRPAVSASALDSGNYSLPQSAAPGTFGLITGPRGADLDLGLVDSTANNSGTYGKLKMIGKNGTIYMQVDPVTGYLQTLGGVGATPRVLSTFGTCNSTSEGQSATQTDSAVACVAGVTAAAGGSTHCQIYCNGTNWVRTGF